MSLFQSEEMVMNVFSNVVDKEDEGVSGGVNLVGHSWWKLKDFKH